MTGFHGIEASGHIGGVFGAGAHPADAKEVAPGGAEASQIGVFAATGEARVMSHGALGNTGTLRFAEHRKETMETVPVLEVFDERSPEGFQGASGVDDLVVQHESAKCIGESGSEPFGEGILAGGAITAADIVNGGVAIWEQGFDYGKDIAGIVLAIGIEGDNDIACCALECQIHGGRLTAVNSVAKEDDARIERRLFLHECRGSIGRTIV